MRARIGIGVAAVILCASVVEAQKPGRFGIGVAISPTLIVADEALPSPSFSFPMNLSSSFRLEPELGYLSAHVEETDPFGGGDYETNLSLLAIGVGAYFLFNAGDGFHLYAGPRLGMQRVSETFKFTGQPEEEMTRTDTFFGVALGGEHFFSSHISLGAEARFTHISLGEEKFKPEPPPGSQPEFKASGNATDGVVFVRFYF